VLSGQLGYNDLTKSEDPKFAALATRTWADGKIGALVSVAYSRRHIQQEGADTTRWDNGPSSGGFCPPTTLVCGLGPDGTPYGGSDPAAYAIANAATTFHPRLPRYDAFQVDDKRLGVTGSLQFKPDDRTTISLDMLYSDFKTDRLEDDFETISWGRTAAQGGKPQTAVRSATVNPENGELVKGVFDGVDVRSEERYDQLETEFKQVTLRGTREVTDKLTVSGLLGLSQSDQTNPVQTTVQIDRPNTQGYSFDFTDERHPILNYGFDVTNPANFELGNGPLGAVQSEIRIAPNATYNNYRTGQIDLTYHFNDDYSLQGGLNYKDFRFKTVQFARLVATTNTPGLPNGVTLADITHVVSPVSGINFPGGTPSSWLAPDVNAFVKAFDLYSNTGTFALTQTGNSTAAGNNRAVEEEDVGAYIQGNAKFELFGLPFRGNAGVRYVKTDQSSYGYQFTTTPILVHANRKYDDWLPSFNLAANVTDDFIVRLAAAKVLVRPGLGNLTPGGTINVSGSNRTVSSGNPDLDPFRAKTADLAAEWYFTKESLLSAGLFYKKIDSFTSSLQVTQPLTAAGIPASAVAGYGLTGDEDFIFSQPVNSPGGDLKGFELNFQTPFRFLPWYFKNLGILANYTYVDSQVKYVKTSTPTATTYITNQLTGLSKNAYNGTLYYDDGKIDMRVSVAYRDKYLTQVPGSNNNDVYGTNSTFNVDAAASYALTPTLKITFDALNLTDEYNDQYVDSTNRMNYYNHTGRQYYMGFRYQF
jgi:iron complex outermembrane receptor protein